MIVRISAHRDIRGGGSSKYQVGLSPKQSPSNLKLIAFRDDRVVVPHIVEPGLCLHLGDIQEVPPYRCSMGLKFV